MSTNSLVAFSHEDGTVTSSYVHWDGYATGVGKTLLENYNSKELARELATTLGYASSLSETVAESHKGRANTDEPEVYANFPDFEEVVVSNSNLEYVYVWDVSPLTNKWMVSTWAQHTTGEGDDVEFSEEWLGFEDLVELYAKEFMHQLKNDI